MPKKLPARLPMNFRQYWDAVGTENVKKIIADLESSMRYFRMMRYGLKKPGRARALQIMESARKHTKPLEPDLELLLAGVPRAGRNPAQAIEPDPAFIQAHREAA